MIGCWFSAIDPHADRCRYRRSADPGNPDTPAAESTYSLIMADQVASNLKSMHELDFEAWNGADWDGRFTGLHTDDVLVRVHGQPTTHGIAEHIAAMKAFVEASGATPPQIVEHPIKFGSGEWTCVVGQFENGSRMVTVAKWRDGAIAEEHIWL